MARRGAWDDAADWTPVWIAFGESWYDGAEPLPWAAHQTLCRTLEQYAGHVRYRPGSAGSRGSTYPTSAPPDQTRSWSRSIARLRILPVAPLGSVHELDQVRHLVGREPLLGPRAELSVELRALAQHDHAATSSP